MAGVSAPGLGQTLPPQAPTAPGPTNVTVIKSQHQRLVFTQDIQRIAVGDTEIVSADLITSREAIVLGRQTGRTTLIVWFANGQSREYVLDRKSTRLNSSH